MNSLKISRNHDHIHKPPKKMNDVCVIRSQKCAKKCFYFLFSSLKWDENKSLMDIKLDFI